jgi:hypothetical protein
MRKVENGKAMEPGNRLTKDQSLRHHAFHLKPDALSFRIPISVLWQKVAGYKEAVSE